MTKKDEALDKIAGYIVPFFTLDGMQVVKMDVVEAIQKIAQDALKGKKK